MALTRLSHNIKINCSWQKVAAVEGVLLRELREKDRMSWFGCLSFPHRRDWWHEWCLPARPQEKDGHPNKFIPSFSLRRRLSVSRAVYFYMFTSSPEDRSLSGDTAVASFLAWSIEPWWTKSTRGALPPRYVYGVTLQAPRLVLRRHYET